MSLPVVAIVGRPNVGKSSLLNALVGRSISIVDPTAGVTRDRVSSPLAIGDGYVELVDTGGYGIEDSDNLTEHVEAQIRYAMGNAALVLFVVDASEGLLPLDTTVAELLRRQDRPVMLVANKCDNDRRIGVAGEFHKLGFGEPICVSAKLNRGRSRLLEAIGGGVEAAEKPTDAAMKIAIVGKRNAGKSTFINALAGEQRVIVSETPGTTRDSVDVRFRTGDREVVAIDTAGVRKKRRMVNDNIEFYSYHRAQRSIRRADVVLLFFDATVPLGSVDKQLSGYITEEFKPVIIVVTKWDLVEGRATQADFAEYIAKMLPHLSYAPISFISAVDGLNLDATVELAFQLHQQASTRVTTGELNRAVDEVLALRGPSQKHGAKRPKVFYATQVGTNPPTLVMFVNSLESFTQTYQRFLLNELRERLPFAETPIRLLFRPKAAQYSDPDQKS